MLLYSYRVRDENGRVKKGYLKASNKENAIQSLLFQKYYILDLNTTSNYNILNNNFFVRVKTQDLINMTRQFSTMLSAGLPIADTLNILEEQTRNKKLQTTISEVKEDVIAGLSIWEALNKHPAIFNNLYINMVRVGEQGGSLRTVLNRLISYLEREQTIELKLRSAFIYPALILVFTILVILFIVSFIMPNLVSMFVASGSTIPWITKAFLLVSETLKGDWYLIIISTVIALLFFKLIIKTKKGKLYWDKFIIKAPIIGSSISQILVARFSRTMGVLVMSGITVIGALETAKAVINNKVMEMAIIDASNSIKEGNSVAKPFAESGVFDSMVIQMIAVGEETGTLDEMLIKVADYFDQEVMYVIDNLITILQPALILIVAFLVGIVVIATILPIFDLINIMGTGF
ncbi:hypothetical protein SYNTR_0341 [Candidatus Syntrophocurvum alkaliphilum]|uniref:Type II secretion system protein GspF domain-containing protein n=1 Tax=Candidatus Syntrophocurvum alkaliphilum TaxID=2293317 RepID=A0A6I6DBW0_9FIRM|nr:type II secretion system F family protein [Candidatus Syntrophocurvum alkaliphilum]QGT98934.1 hypothetical protein SYNTR_0341 [Candidatus Syntrophocurvum alkaliphilum]